MSLRVCIPGASGCAGVIPAKPRASGCVVAVCRSFGGVRPGDGSLNLRLRSDGLRAGRSLGLHCVASDAASAASVAEENVAVDGEVGQETSPVENAEASAPSDSSETAVSSDGAAAQAAVAKKSWDTFEALKARREEDWNRAESFLSRGSVFQGRVEFANQGGVVVRFYGLRGFVPYSQLTKPRMQRDPSKTVQDAGRDLIGQYIPCRVVEVDRNKMRLVCSEKKAVWTQYLPKMQAGAVVDGIVSGLVDYGAFVDIKFPDGAQPAVGLLHIREISWDPIGNPRDVLQVGQQIKVKVVNVDEESMRVALSLKQLQADPLMETLDTLMPKESEVEETLMNTPIPGIDDICKELEKENGVTSVTLGRQKLEKHIVSQDLELWLSQTPSENGQFTLLARAGRQVQEVHVQSSLGRDEMKVAVRRVTQKIP